jgi:CrcB protein
VSAWVWLAVLAVGGVGAIGRFLLDSLISGRAGRELPYGTFTINMLGALVLGLLAGLALAPTLYTIAGTATIGSFTTFSTWMFETQRLAEDSEIRRAVLNTVASLAAGFAIAVLGHAIGVRL